MEISIRRFGGPQREVLGLLQYPQASKAHRAAFLMCRPFGQEAVRTSPIFRAGSDRLAREGCTVLTVDHHGCGDSPGELEGQTLPGWTHDTLAADAQLRSDAPAVPIHWFGMGLGATVVALAAMNAEPAPSCIVLWEPVLNGRGYMDRLLIAHREDLSREMGRHWRQLVQRGEPEPELPGSVLGFTLGAGLFGELQRLTELPLASIAKRGIRIVLVLKESQRDGLQASGLPGLTLQAVETPINWMSTVALGTAIVPQEIPRTLLGTL